MLILMKQKTLLGKHWIKLHYYKLKNIYKPPKNGHRQRCQICPGNRGIFVRKIISRYILKVFLKDATKNVRLLEGSAYRRCPPREISPYAPVP